MNVYELILRWSVSCMLLFVMLTGCAQRELATAEPAAPKPKLEASPEKTTAVSMAPGEELVPDPAVMNPVTVVFDKLSVKLSEADKRLLAQIKDRAQKARVLTITGYCDRKQVQNAKAAAIARAASVRNELLRLGIKPKSVRIKYVTDAANKHAAEIAL